MTPEIEETPTPTLTPTPTFVLPPPGGGGGGGGIVVSTPAGEETDLTPTITPLPTQTPVRRDIVLAEVVDLSLLLANTTTTPGGIFTLDILVEPNLQEITVITVALSFNPNHLQAVSISINPDSPLTTKLLPSDYFFNSTGFLALTVGPRPELEISDFEQNFIMGSILFQARLIEATTDVSFIEFGVLQTRADIEGAIVTGDLAGSRITITNNPPTPTPTPVPTPTPTPTPGP